MSRAVLKQIADLEHMTTAESQDRRLQLVGSEPPRCNREFLIRRLAYRIQELAHVGIALSARFSRPGVVASCVRSLSQVASQDCCKSRERPCPDGRRGGL